MGYINDLTALKMSSNVYMFKTAMNIAGVPYVRGGTLDIQQKSYDTMRYYFGQFGLGVKLELIYRMKQLDKEVEQIKCQVSY